MTNKNKWSKAWKSSTKPSKQRLYVYNAQLHTMGAFLHSHLSKELRQKLKHRALRVRTGDTVVVCSGSFKGTTGKVEKVDVKKRRVYVTGVEMAKKDGSKAKYPLVPSVLLIKELDTTDKRRLA